MALSASPTTALVQRLPRMSEYTTLEYARPTRWRCHLLPAARGENGGAARLFDWATHEEYDCAGKRRQAAYSQRPGRSISRPARSDQDRSRSAQDPADQLTAESVVAEAKGVAHHLA